MYLKVMKVMVLFEFFFFVIEEAAVIQFLYLVIQ